MADSYKVAVASASGVNVDSHYGKSRSFFVYSVDDDEGYDFLERRTVSQLCMDGSHIKSAMDERAGLFSDCRYIVASRFGDCAVSSLASVGITPMELPGSIDDAILGVWKYNRIQTLFNPVKSQEQEIPV